MGGVRCMRRTTFRFSTFVNVFAASSRCMRCDEATSVCANGEKEFASAQRLTAVVNSNSSFQCITGVCVCHTRISRSAQNRIGQTERVTNANQENKKKAAKFNLTTKNWWLQTYQLVWIHDDTVLRNCVCRIVNTNF